MLTNDTQLFYVPIYLSCVMPSVIRFKCTNKQSWSPRGHGLGLETPRGQPIVSLALALALDFGNLFPVLVVGFEPKSANSLLKAMFLYQQL